MFWEGLPDLEASFDIADVRPGWEAGTGVVVPEISRKGTPVPFAPRNLLRDAVDAWAGHGMTPRVGIELEAFLFQPDDSGGWKPIDTPGHFVYGTGMAVDPTGVMDKIMAGSREVGFPLEAVNSEYDNGQFELTLTYDDAMIAADNAFLFKVMAKEIAAREGYLLTFMGKPINGRGGSGFHINLSKHDEYGDNLQSEDTAEHGLSETCRSLISGKLHHPVGKTALMAPTVKAFYRLPPGSLCG
jgi:glutamine synthetase